MKFKLFGKKYVWKFENMHESLQILAGICAIIATLGYFLAGWWLLYLITIR